MSEGQEGSIRGEQVGEHPEGVLAEGEVLSRLDETEVDGKPALRVGRTGPDGDVRHLVTLEDFRRGATRVTPDKRFAFIPGMHGDAAHVYIVDTTTGELVPADGLPYYASLWLVPPYAQLEFADVLPQPTQADQ